MDRTSLLEATERDGWNARTPALTSMVLGKKTDAEAVDAMSDTSKIAKETADFMLEFVQSEGDKKLVSLGVRLVVFAAKEVTIMVKPPLADCDG